MFAEAPFLVTRFLYFVLNLREQRRFGDPIRNAVGASMASQITNLKNKFDELKLYGPHRWRSWNHSRNVDASRNAVWIGPSLCLLITC